MAKKNSPSAYIVALMLFLGGAGYLIYSGISENTVYFLNVSEALAAEKTQLSAARLFGTVGAQDIERLQEGLGVAFTLVDKDDMAKSLSVRYHGAVPDTFKVGAEVIVEGGLGQDGVFSAKTLMTKCPSKYQKENREASNT